ncbi:unnamed protein product [Ilex paraguariensis]|uniref:CCHC-type domain-containing protein n=1 Tax=Ilex paraguariensis TaxID=185542 RepID=A0ABC8U143_9AQUA
MLIESNHNLLKSPSTPTQQLFAKSTSFILVNLILCLSEKLYLGKDCFICKQGGHRANDCPDKLKGGSQGSRMCLNCGDSGHDMFSCRNDYCSDDLKEIQCYICKSFGHLCCANIIDTSPKEVSCYRCGQLGHTGLSCMGSRGETTDVGSLSSCYRCGEEGHFARECSAKVSKRTRELSTPRQKFPKENRDYLEIRSVPHDLGKPRKKRKNQYVEGGFTRSGKGKQRGGWITEDPGDIHHYEAKANGWRSPVTPTNKNSKISNFIASGHASNSRASWKTRKLHFENSASNGSAKFYEHRFSASRFGNSSSDGMRRNYDR